MEGSKESEYRYDKVYLYPRDGAPGGAGNPYGTVEINAFRNRGRLKCRITEGLSRIVEKHSDCQFPVLLRKEGEKQGISIGNLKIDRLGCGELEWEFNTAGGESERTGGSVRYNIVVAYREDENMNSGQSYHGVISEGRFTLPGNAQDTRIIGFKKDVNTKGHQNPDRNPLFHRVEPFFPPMPNTIWWRISIQPDFRRAYLQEDYCPRQNAYKAVF